MDQQDPPHGVAFRGSSPDPAVELLSRDEDRQPGSGHVDDARDDGLGGRADLVVGGDEVQSSGVVLTVGGGDDVDEIVSHQRLVRGFLTEETGLVSVADEGEEKDNVLVRAEAGKDRLALRIPGGHLDVVQFPRTEDAEGGEGTAGEEGLEDLAEAQQQVVVGSGLGIGHAGNAHIGLIGSRGRGR